MRFSQQFRWFTACGWLVLVCFAARGQEVASKKRIAVLNFDNPNVGSDAPSGLFGADGEDVGKGVSTRLIQKLVEGGKFTLVDRSALAKLLKEQTDVESDRVDAYGMATRIGRMLRLDAMVIGAITRYGPEEKHKDAGGGMFGSGWHTRKSKAYVEIAARVLNISTGEIMAEFRSAGESVRSGEITTIGKQGRSKSSLEMLSGEFVESLLDEATGNAVDQIAAQLNQFADKIPVLSTSIESVIAEVTGSVLTLNLGKKSWLKVGDQVEIFRDGKGGAEPTGSSTLPSAREKIGVATVTEVEDDYSTATFSGSGQAQVGDRARAKDSFRELPH